MGGAVAVVLVFEEGEMSGLVEDDDRSSVLKVVVVVAVVVFFLPPSSFFLLLLLQLLLDFIVTIGRSFLMFIEAFDRCLTFLLLFNPMPKGASSKVSMINSKSRNTQMKDNTY
jgi:hypothetical protein